MPKLTQYLDCQCDGIQEIARICLCKPFIEQRRLTKMVHRHFAAEFSYNKISDIKGNELIRSDIMKIFRKADARALTIT